MVYPGSDPFSYRVDFNLTWNLYIHKQVEDHNFRFDSETMSGAIRTYEHTWINGPENKYVKDIKWALQVALSFELHRY